MMLNVAEQKQSWFIGKKSTHIPTGLIVSVLILLELLVVVAILGIISAIGTISYQGYVGGAKKKSAQN